MEVVDGVLSPRGRIHVRHSRARFVLEHLHLLL